MRLVSVAVLGDGVAQPVVSSLRVKLAGIETARTGLAPRPLWADRVAAVYLPRSPTTGVLYGVVRTRLTELLAAVDAQTDGGGLPGFVVNEFGKFLRCGVLGHGFARVRCGDCAFERLVPFSCKGRAICPSCGGRRMAERAAHLVDHVLPADVPIRQWVLSVPHRLRYRLAYDHRLCRTVLHVFVRALRNAYRREARRQGLSGGETGMVTSVQRFGGAVNVHLHFHTLVLDAGTARDCRHNRRVAWSAWTKFALSAAHDRGLMTRLHHGGIATITALMVLESAPAAASVAPRDLANGCFAARSAATAKFVAAAGDGYRGDQASETAAAAFYLKPSGLGTYLPYDQDGKLLSVRGSAAVGRDEVPGPATEWTLPRVSSDWFAIKSTATGRQLAVSPSGVLVQTDPEASGPERLFALVPEGRCREFPEAEVGAAGKPFTGTEPDGTVSGFADMHLHITAELRAGGQVIYGEPFDRFGITEALGHDADVHGPDGSLDVTGNLLRTGLPVGTHDTHGWPTFAGWPVHDTNTHQQTYYVWLKRAWMAGERLVVAQTVEDEPLCELEPRRSHSCDETETIELEIQQLRELQDYVDAQSGGPGRGWFRLVYDPGQARRAIERGQLAVVIGIESSNLFGCSEFLDQPQCTRADVDRGISRFRSLGVRSLFPIHWVDNAFGGAAIEGGDKGTFIGAMQVLQTGHPFRTGPCPEPGQGEEVLTPGPQCNTKGLTALGEYLIRRLIDEHMLIEADHMSELTRLRVLQIAEEEQYPLVSSHTHTGGHWTDSDLNRLYALGGLAAATPDTSPELAAKILELQSHRSERHFFGVPLGTDTGASPHCRVPGLTPASRRCATHSPHIEATSSSAANAAASGSTTSTAMASRTTG